MTESLKIIVTSHLYVTCYSLGLDKHRGELVQSWRKILVVLTYGHLDNFLLGRIPVI